MKLTTKARKKLPTQKFALPKERKYPIHTKKHASVAKGYAKQMLDKGKLSKAKYDIVVRKANKVLKKK